MKKFIKIAVLTLVPVLILAGCAGTDVVLKYAPESFAKIIEKHPELVTDNTEVDHYYYLTVDGETTLKISHDNDLTGSDDLVLATPLKPFTDAGLDITKLGSGYKADSDTFYVTIDNGKGTGMQKSVTESLFESVTADRTHLSYHQKLDHYGVTLGGGKFEWAKDETTNDKDIVFVIKAQPLRDLDVDVAAIEGWTFATVQDADGTNVDVLLKPYDLNV